MLMRAKEAPVHKKTLGKTVKVFFPVKKRLYFGMLADSSALWKLAEHQGDAIDLHSVPVYPNAGMHARKTPVLQGFATVPAVSERTDLHRRIFL